MTPTTSPRALGRAIAILALLTILAAIFAQGFVSERLIDFHDAAATAGDVLGNKGLLYGGYAAYLIEMTGQIAAAALWYRLLKPVNRNVALVGVFIELAGCI